MSYGEFVEAKLNKHPIKTKNSPMNNKIIKNILFSQIESLHYMIKKYE